MTFGGTGAVQSKRSVKYENLVEEPMQDFENVKRDVYDKPKIVRPGLNLNDQVLMFNEKSGSSSFQPSGQTTEGRHNRHAVELVNTAEKSKSK